MNNGDSPIAAMAAQFAIFSLIAFGGGSTVYPEIHRFVVETKGWMDDRTFVDLFAVGRAVPGPNIMFVTMIGWQVAGLLGAVVVAAAMCVPSAVTCFVFVRLWNRFPSLTWRRAIETALAWLAAGLMIASGYVLTLAADTKPAQFVVTAVTVAIATTTRMNPLWILGVAAALGAAGLI